VKPLRCAGALLLALGAIGAAHAISLGGPDIEAIRRAAGEFHAGPMTQLSAASAGCPQTEEQGCASEVQVTIATGQGPRQLTVSKVGGRWIVGRRQRQQLQGDAR
jgi:hypothetical protein